jgi:hypothetical protein
MSAILAMMASWTIHIGSANYGKVAAAFNAVSDKFSADAGRCNPEADGVDIVRESDDVRASWLNVAVTAVELDKLVPILQAAAQLAGVTATVHRDLGGADAISLPLVCDPGELHRRRVWEAWGAKGRCGRWSALVALGARIRAAELDSFAAYRSPRPKEYRIKPGSETTHGHQMYWFDPEDDPAQEPEPVTPRRARVLAR